MRTAPNSGEFLERIKHETDGLVVRLLDKAEEGRIGALGVASSVRAPNGLVMDLGGGSTQLTWVVQREDGLVSTCPRGSLSFPYGAAALKLRLEKEGKKGKGLREEMKQEFRRAYHQLEIPGSLTAGGGLDLYLSGGGFRGWGYLLMSRARIDPYPIPIINGFKGSKEEFRDTGSVVSAVSEADVKVFGVSKRRASQIPAVAVLVDVLVEALPMIQSIQFCQGGVREGFLFDKLPPEIGVQDPLLAGTSPYASSSSDSIATLLQSALPTTSSPIESTRPPDSLSPNFLRGLGNMLFAHCNIPKETRSAAALHCTTTGILASVNNLTHADRALLALILSERWAGDVAPTDEAFRYRLRRCVSAKEAWWARYVGRVATMIGDLYPSGVVPDPGRARLETEWESVTKKKERCDLLVLKVVCHPDAAVFRETLEDTAERVEKVGKKKNWEGYGVRVDIRLI